MRHSAWFSACGSGAEPVSDGSSECEACDGGRATRGVGSASALRLAHGGLRRACQLHPDPRADRPPMSDFTRSGHVSLSDPLRTLGACTTTNHLSTANNRQPSVLGFDAPSSPSDPIQGAATGGAASSPTSGCRFPVPSTGRRRRSSSRRRTPSSGLTRSREQRTNGRWRRSPGSANGSTSTPPLR